MRIMDYTEKRKKDYFGYYVLAAIAGVLIFYLFLFAFKFLMIIIRFSISNWKYLVGGLVILLLLRRMIKRKKKIVITK